ncbi:MAG: ABC transporter permease [Oscillospiraceae bacterium]|nr:ABC transporter permease [Oscillospiraceae bacterium]
MKTLVLNTKNELSKLLRKKKYIVIGIIGALVCILRLGGNVMIAKVSDGEVVIKSNLITEMLGFVVDILVPLIVFMAVTDLFASEVQEDTFKESLMRPLTRFKVMTSKSLAVFLLCCMTILAMFVICLAVQMVSGNSLAYVPQTLAAYVVDMVPVLALVAMAVFINMLSKSPTLAMLLCIAVYIFFKYLNYYVSPAGQMIFTAYSQWHKIWIGSLLPLGALLSKVGILFGSVLILYTLSYIIFDGKDY